MHWIQTVRENLQLTQEEIAIYLQLSIHMVKSVELGRRELPFESMAPAIAIFNAMRDSQAHDPVSDTVSSKNDHLRELKRLNSQYRRRLEEAADELKKMQKMYESACLRLDVYQSLAKDLATSGTKDDLARLRWINMCIERAKQCIKDNNATAQGIHSAKMAGMKAVKQALEKMLD